MVDTEGRNRYPKNDNWLTDGYGDYVRHYLRAMAVYPELSPSNEEHILYSSSVLQKVEYEKQIIEKLKYDSYDDINANIINNIRVRYSAFEKKGTEKIRLLKRPTQVLLNNKPIKETDSLTHDGYKWNPMNKGGILTINRMTANEVTVID